MFGWEGDSLQRAMDAQCDVVCPELQEQDVSTANQCTLPRWVDEDIDGRKLNPRLATWFFGGLFIRSQRLMNAC